MVITHMDSEVALGADQAVALERGCRSAVGDRLRSVTYVDSGAVERVYHRSDLPTGADQVAFALADEREEPAVADGGHSVGPFEAGFVTQIQQGDAAVVVTSDGLKMDRGRELSALVRRVLE